MRPEYIKMAIRNLLDRTFRDPERVVFIFDIDYCLYQDNDGVIKSAESAFQENVIKTHFKDKPDILSESKKMYGTSKILPYYQKGYSMDDIKNKIDFGRHVPQYVERDLRLKRELMSISYEKHCLTNGFQSSAQKILRNLGVEEEFEYIFCPDDSVHPFWIVKPRKDAFNFVNIFLNIKKGITQVYFFDDSLANINAAREVGWNARHVKKGECVIDLIMEVNEELSRENPAVGKAKKRGLKSPANPDIRSPKRKRQQMAIRVDN